MSGLATASLISAILGSMCLGPVGGLAAVIPATRATAVRDATGEVETGADGAAGRTGVNGMASARTDQAGPAGNYRFGIGAGAEITPRAGRQTSAETIP